MDRVLFQNQTQVSGGADKTPPKSGQEQFRGGSYIIILFFREFASYDFTGAPTSRS